MKKIILAAVSTLLVGGIGHAKDMAMGMPKDMAAGMPKDMATGMPKDMATGMPASMPMGMETDMATDMASSSKRTKYLEVIDEKIAATTDMKRQERFRNLKAKVSAMSDADFETWYSAQKAKKNAAKMGAGASSSSDAADESIEEAVDGSE